MEEEGLRGRWLAEDTTGQCSVMTVVYAAVEVRVLVAALAVIVGSAVASTVAPQPPHLVWRPQLVVYPSAAVALIGLVVGERVVLVACLALGGLSSVDRPECLRRPVAHGASTPWAPSMMNFFDEVARCVGRSILVARSHLPAAEETSSFL